MADEYRIRPATPGDAPIIARHRGAMFRSMGEFNDAAAREVAASSLPLLEEMMRRGEYLGWLVLCDGQIVAGGGMVLRELLPRPGALRGGIEGLIVNVYTEPEHRHRGLARRLMQTMLGWCAQHGVASVVLHASDEGRRLYQSLGFAPTNEMRLQASGRGE